MPDRYAPTSLHRLAFLAIVPILLLVQTIFPPLQIRLDDRNCRQNTETRNGPRNNLDDLDLMAETQATFNLAFEFVETVSDAIVLAFDISPHLVDQNTGDDPEDGRHDEEDLAVMSVTARHGCTG